jgi:molecular chaperone HscB
MNLADDDFTLFGLPHQYALNRTALDERWRELQSRVHPDRFAADGSASQRLAMQWAVRVNQAYQRLKDPLARGAYLCELRGVQVQAENNTAMPSAFLVQQMQWREALDDATDTPAVQALQAEVAGAERQLLALLQAALDDAQDTLAAAAQVRALMFVARFRQDIDQRLEALDA